MVREWLLHMESDIYKKVLKLLMIFSGQDIAISLVNKMRFKPKTGKIMLRCDSISLHNKTRERRALKFSLTKLTEMLLESSVAYNWHKLARKI